MRRAIVVLAALAITSAGVAISAPKLPDHISKLRTDFETIAGTLRTGGTPDDGKRALAAGEKLLAALIREKGEASRDVVKLLISLVDYRRIAGDASGARDSLVRAAHLALITIPDDDDALLTLGLALEREGMLLEAEPVLRRRLANAERGSDKRWLILPLEDLSKLVSKLGRFDEAEALWRRLVDLATHDPWSATAAPTALFCLAIVQCVRHELSACEASLREGIRLAQPQPSPSPTTLADFAKQGGVAMREPGMALSRAHLEAGLAAILDVSGAHEEARTWRDRGLLSYEQDGAVPVGVYVSLAEDAIARGDLDEGAAFADRVHELGDTVDGDLERAAIAITRGDRDTAEVALRAALEVQPSPQILQHLAELYLDLGQPRRAESLIETAHDLEAGAQGGAFVLGILRTWARAAEANGRTGDAVERYRGAFAVSEAMLRAVHLGLQEQRLLALLADLDDEQDQVWTLTGAHANNERVLALGLAEALLRKGRALDELAAAARVSRVTGDTAAPIARLVALRHEYASEILSGRGRRLAELDAKIAKLAREVPLELERKLPDPDHVVAAVRARLGLRERLVEIVSYRPVAFVDGAFKPISSPHYLAFVVGARSISAVDLGPSDVIDGLVHDLREQISHRDRPAADPSLVAAQRALYDAVLGHVDLGGATEVILALEGALQVVPFEALRDHAGELIERYHFRYVTSGRDLLARPGHATSEVRIVADPAFPTAPIRLGSIVLAPPEPLPYTRAEADDITKLFFGARLLTGEAATADAVLSGPAPGILHVATHGVFLDDTQPPTRGTRGVAVVAIDEPLGVPAAPSPMLRSVLLLAHDKLGHDAVVTAYRLANANLDGTQLVVLSACETGLGDRRRNQGIFGLRRALLIAGAETVVTSLWRVGDASTRELMVAYYRRLLAGAGRVSSLRDAALELRGRQPHPFYWAGFVAVGAASPLRLTEIKARR